MGNGDIVEAPVTSTIPARLAGVRFQYVGKVYHFDASSHPDLRIGDYVIVETSRGRQMGQVASIEPLTDKKPVEGPLKPIERRATGRDLAVRRYWEGKELEALIICREINQKLNLPIKIVKAEYSFDGTRLTFLYSSDSEEKIETKDLRQEIGKSFRARVEMKLIGPRDVAKILGGFGACGEVRCCSRFLTEFSPVSIKMAKHQDLPLSPTEISGQCGRLLCCLGYEDQYYVETKARLPRAGHTVVTPMGPGKVIGVSALRESVRVLLESEAVVELTAEELRQAAEGGARAAEDQPAAVEEDGAAEDENA